MINLLKMDFYRMLHTKAAWIILVVAMLFAGFSMSMTKVDDVETLLYLFMQNEKMVI